MGNKRLKGGDNLGFLRYVVDYFQPNKVMASKIIDLLNRGYSLTQIFGGNIYNIPEIRTAIIFDTVTLFGWK